MASFLWTMKRRSAAMFCVSGTPKRLWWLVSVHKGGAIARVPQNGWFMIKRDLWNCLIWGSCGPRIYGNPQCSWIPWVSTLKGITSWWLARIEIGHRTFLTGRDTGATWCRNCGHMAMDQKLATLVNIKMDRNTWYGYMFSLMSSIAIIKSYLMQF